MCNVVKPDTDSCPDINSFETDKLDANIELNDELPLIYWFPPIEISDDINSELVDIRLLVIIPFIDKSPVPLILSVNIVEIDDVENVALPETDNVP